MQIYLYIKTHNITGLKYFGKTTNKDPFKYKGSGKYWKRHIRKYGYDVNTEIFGQYTDESLCSLAALKFSEENDIVNSELWANLQEENGYDGAPIGHIGHQFTSEEKQKMSSLLKERWEDDNYKNKLINVHKQRHVDNPNLKYEISKKAIARQKNKGILVDHTGTQYEIHKEFLTKYNLDRTFLIDLDQRITKPSLKKLGLSNDEGKTKRELGFTFLQ